MSVVQLINEGVFGFIEAIMILLLFGIIYHKKTFILKNKIKSIVFATLYTAFSYWSSTYIPIEMHTIFISIFLVIALSVITQIKLYIAIVLVAMMYIFMAITEFAVFSIGMILFKLDLGTILYTPLLKMFFTVVVKSVQGLLIWMLFYVKLPYPRQDVFQKENSVMALTMLQMFVMGSFLLSINYVVSHEVNITVYNIFLFLIYILFIYLNFLDYKERERILRLKQTLQRQDEYVKNLENVMSIIRREKHDFANHLNTLLAICILGKQDAASKVQAYIRKLTNNMNAAYRFFNTGNDYIDGLLAIKNNHAFGKNIYLEVDFEVPLSHLSIDDNDLTSIIGNITDNAIEAIASEKYKQDKVVSVSTFIEDGYYCISISDNGPEIPKEIMNKIFENGFSTKTNSNKDHGFGLHIVKQLAEKNGGQISVSSTPEETEFIIKFEIEEEKNRESCFQNYQRHIQRQSPTQGLAD